MNASRSDRKEEENDPGDGKRRSTWLTVVAPLQVPDLREGIPSGALTWTEHFHIRIAELVQNRPDRGVFGSVDWLFFRETTIIVIFVVKSR